MRNANNIFRGLSIAKSIPLHRNRPTYFAYNAQLEFHESNEFFFQWACLLCERANDCARTRRCVINVAIAYTRFSARRTASANEHPRLTRGIDEFFECVIARPQRRAMRGQPLEGDFVTRVRDFTATRITRLRNKRSGNGTHAGVGQRANSRRVSRVIGLQTDKTRADLRRRLSAIRDDRRKTYNNWEPRSNREWSFCNIRARMYNDDKIDRYHEKRFFCAKTARRDD